MSTFVLASRNIYKVKEMQTILQNIDHSLISLSDYEKKHQLKIAEVEETGDTFYENALLKAENLFKHCHLPIIADDSGLVVPLLHGEPGVHSARYASNIVGEDITAQDNINKLLNELKKKPNFYKSTPAYFTTVIVTLLIQKSHHINSSYQILVSEGRCEGTIINEQRGSNGFGYDPIFIPEMNNPNNLTFAEMESHDKNLVSHRFKAIKKLIVQLEKIKD